MPSNSPSLQTLLAQFQSRYPAASLIAELLTIHQDSYVVRALVQLGGTTLATGMAAAAEIELAEDRAKVRALEAIGIQVSSSAELPPQIHSSAYELPQLGETDSSKLPDLGIIPALQLEPESANAPTSNPTIPLGLTPPIQAESLLETQDYSQPPEETPIATSSDHFFTSYGEIESQDDEFIPEPDPLPPPTNGKPAKKKAASAPNPEVLTEEPPQVSTDRSEEIARIGVEMKRLGWTTAQGREHLKRTYGKRSRQELDDTELLDFLQYLESQPSSTQSPF